MKCFIPLIFISLFFSCSKDKEASEYVIEQIEKEGCFESCSIDSTDIDFNVPLSHISIFSTSSGNLLLSYTSSEYCMLVDSVSLEGETLKLYLDESQSSKAKKCPYLWNIEISYSNYSGLQFLLFSKKNNDDGFIEVTNVSYTDIPPLQSQ